MFVTKKKLHDLMKSLNFRRSLHVSGIAIDESLSERSNRMEQESDALRMSIENLGEKFRLRTNDIALDVLRLTEALGYRRIEQPQQTKFIKIKKGS